MKRLLIISPHFPPVNAADMQRVRMSLPYFKALDWETEVVTVNENYVDMIKDPLLMESIPSTIVIHKVKAFSKSWTSKFGLGSLALRSMWFYRKKIDQILYKNKFDLIYFSTTEFPICILGSYWKKKFGIPYLIDMQDPWHSDYYQDKPKSERPKKYWFSYRLHKYLEPIAMKNVAGLISVSANYIEVLKHRYVELSNKPNKVITFGAHEIDFNIAKKNNLSLPLVYKKENNRINLVYVGRGGYDMQQAISLLFNGFKRGIKDDFKLFNNIHFHFIGTSYAPKGKGIATIAPLAAELGISAFVTEHTDRIGFYQSIKNLQEANGLIIIGSNDAAYTASKLYPYILAKKQLLAIFHPSSSAVKIIKDCNAGDLITLDQDADFAYNTLHDYLLKVIQNKEPITNWTAFEPYTSAFLSEKQVEIFNEIIN